MERSIVHNNFKIEFQRRCLAHKCWPGVFLKLTHQPIGNSTQGPRIITKMTILLKSPYNQIETALRLAKISTLEIHLLNKLNELCVRVPIRVLKLATVSRMHYLKRTSFTLMHITNPVSESVNGQMVCPEMDKENLFLPIMCSQMVYLGISEGLVEVSVSWLRQTKLSKLILYSAFLRITDASFHLMPTKLSLWFLHCLVPTNKTVLSVSLSLP